MNGAIYGCVVLHSSDSKAERLDFPFVGLDKIDHGNHITRSYHSDRMQSFDYVLGGNQVEQSKLFVSIRGRVISGLRIGEVYNYNVTHKTIQLLLAMNTEATDEEQNATFLELVHNKVFRRIEGRFFLALDIISSQPKFVLASRDVPIYLIAFCDDSSMYLLWTNEASLEDRMREHYGERFSFYRMKTLLNGTCVIQSKFLRHKLTKWRDIFSDKLKIMNALERQLYRKVRYDSDSHFVNDRATADQSLPFMEIK